MEPCRGPDLDSQDMGYEHHHMHTSTQLKESGIIHSNMQLYKESETNQSKRLYNPTSSSSQLAKQSSKPHLHLTLSITF